MRALCISPVVVAESVPDPYFAVGASGYLGKDWSRYEMRATHGQGNYPEDVEIGIYYSTWPEIVRETSKCREGEAEDKQNMENAGIDQDPISCRMLALTAAHLPYAIRRDIS